MKKETTDLMTFGDRLAYTRKKKGLTQKQLGALIGLTASSFSYYEKLTRKPQMPMLRKITKALEVSDNWFENDDNFKGHDIEHVKKLTNFGQHLAYTRKKKGLNQPQFAKLIGTNRSKICNLETGNQNPDVFILSKIIKALEVPDDWFENDDNFKEPVKKLINFGQRLAYTRKKKGLKQTQLAELIGMSPSTIGYLERGYQTPNVSILSKIIKALEVSDNWFENDDNFKIQTIKPVKGLTKKQQQLVAKNEWLIHYLFYQFFHYPKNEEEYEYYYGYAAISLCEVAMIYDESKGPFSAIARIRIQSAMSRAYKNGKKDVQPLTSLDKPLGDDSDSKNLDSIIPDPDDKFEQLEYKILVESVCQKVEPVLADKEKEVFRLWLHGNTAKKIAKATGLSYGAVHNELKAARNKCRASFSPEEMFA